MVGLEYWPVVATGVVILIAIAASNRALRRELGGRITEVHRELSGRIDGLTEGVTEVRERLARVEGLLEGIWFRPQQSDGKERGGAD